MTGGNLRVFYEGYCPSRRITISFFIIFQYYSFVGLLVLLVITTLLQLSFLLRVTLYAATTVTYIVVHFLIIDHNLDELDRITFAQGYR